MVNRRADYQRLCEELRVSKDSRAKTRLKKKLTELILEDDSYARGFIEDTLRRTLRFVSPTVGRDQGRPFSLTVEIHQNEGKPVAIVGASFLPKVGDDVEALISYFGEELYGLARMRGFDWLIQELAVNGTAISPS